MQMKSGVTESKAEAGIRGRKDLKVVEVAFLPTTGAENRLGKVYDRLLPPQNTTENATIAQQKRDKNVTDIVTKP